MIQSPMRWRCVLTFVASLVVLMLAALTSPTQIAQAGLPPRPTPQPASSEAALAGMASIELRVHLGQMGQAVRWQELWTVVQWQDASGKWHDVEGWRGALDEMVNGEGRKVWWVYRRDLGTGPFRWVIYQSPSGGLLASSNVFHLPGAEGQAVDVAVKLKP